MIYAMESANFSFHSYVNEQRDLHALQMRFHFCIFLSRSRPINEVRWQPRSQ